MTCVYCGASLRSGAKFCSSCGSEAAPAPTASPPPPLPPELPPSQPNRAVVLLAASLGVVLLLGVVWMLTSSGSGDDVAATTTTEITVVESTTRTIPPPETSITQVTTTTAPTTTTTLTAEQAAYVSSLSAVLSDAQSAAGDLEAASSFWDAQKDSLEAAERSRLWRTTQGAFRVAILELEDVQAALSTVDVPDDAARHDEIVTAVDLLVQYAEEALEGLQLPRGSEEVDGTMRLEAIANLNATLDQLRDAVSAL